MKLTTQILQEQANIVERATRLFENGYRAVEVSGLASKPAPIRILTPQGEAYLVDRLTKTCTCAYFTKRNPEVKPFEERLFCKHYYGAEKLLLETEAEACEMDVETYRRWKEENEAEC